MTGAVAVSVRQPMKLDSAAVPVVEAVDAYAHSSHMEEEDTVRAWDDADEDPASTRWRDCKAQPEAMPAVVVAVAPIVELAWSPLIASFELVELQLGSISIKMTTEYNSAGECQWSQHTL